MPTVPQSLCAPQSLYNGSKDAKGELAALRKKLEEEQSKFAGACQEISKLQAIIDRLTAEKKRLKTDLGIATAAEIERAAELKTALEALDEERTTVRRRLVLSLSLLGESL